MLLTMGRSRLAYLSRPIKAHYNSEDWATMDPDSDHGAEQQQGRDEDDSYAQAEAGAGSGAGACSSGADILRDDQGLQLKRSVSPPHMSSGSRTGSLRKAGGHSSSGAAVCGAEMADAEVAKRASSPAVPSEDSVRGSLTLLKTKAGSRRRRSIADIEQQQQQQQVKSNPGVSGDAGVEQEPLTPTSVPFASRGLHNSSTSTAHSTHTAGAAVATVTVDLSAINVLGADDYGQPSPHASRSGSTGAGSSLPAQTFQSADPYGDDAVENSTVPMCRCPDCGRQFREGTSFQKHARVCAKVFLQKRKTFDSTKMRAQAIPELQGHMPPTQRQKSSSSSSTLARSSSARGNALHGGRGSGGKWREQSNAFRDAMRAARDVSQALATGTPLPPPVPSAPDPSLVQCPHCSRRFSSKAAERHIPQVTCLAQRPARIEPLFCYPRILC